MSVAPPSVLIEELLDFLERKRESRKTEEDVEERTLEVSLASVDPEPLCLNVEVLERRKMPVTPEELDCLERIDAARGTSTMNWEERRLVDAVEAVPTSQWRVFTLNMESAPLLLSEPPVRLCRLELDAGTSGVSEGASEVVVNLSKRLWRSIRYSSSLWVLSDGLRHGDERDILA